MSRYPNGDTLEEARLLLPWYITGKLTEPEKELVQRMLEQHPVLQAEYEREVTLVDLIRENHSLLQLTAVDTTGQRLDKLMRRIERENQGNNAAGAAKPASPALDQAQTTISTPASAQTSPRPLSTRCWQFLQNLLPSNVGFTPTNAVFASLVVVQAGLVGWYVWSANPMATVSNSALTTTTYQTATAPIVATAKDLELLVDFNDAVQIRQVRDFLQRWNAHIIDGPDVNADNYFRLEVRGVQPQDAKQADTIVQQMQQEQTVINFAGKATF
ncbi:MAG: hypothetical protein RI964_1135 [Pseudomonadota bacterium]|jgi:hypothetical protein